MLMKEFFQRNKAFIIGVIATCVLIIGGIYLFSNKNSLGSDNSSKTYDSSILVPDSAYKTSGIINNSYLAASSSANVTLVEFGDYVCPACGFYAPVVKKILTDYAGKITYVFRNYPLSYHTNAPAASHAAEAAGIQGKFWEMHDALYSNQNSWSEASDPLPIFVGYAKDLGLDVNKFQSDMNLDSIKTKIKNDVSDGNRVNLTETPTFILNGKKIILTSNMNDLESEVSSAVGK